jgi:hypothetical protein
MFVILSPPNPLMMQTKRTREQRREEIPTEEEAPTSGNLPPNHHPGLDFFWILPTQHLYSPAWPTAAVFPSTPADMEVSVFNLVENHLHPYYVQ